MDQILLSDKNIVPTEKVIFQIIGETEFHWRQLFSYLGSKEITANWKYSDCGKEWFCQATKKKKSVFWLQIRRSDSFSIGFPFGDKQEADILKSDLPESIKDEFLTAKRFNTTRYIAIHVSDRDDIENIKKLIDIKVG